MPWLFRIIDALPIPVVGLTVFAGVVLVITGAIWWVWFLRIVLWCAIPYEWQQWRHRRVQREIRNTLSRRYGA